MRLFDPELHKGAPEDLFGQARYLYEGIMETAPLIAKNGPKQLIGRANTYLNALLNGNWSFDKDKSLFNDVIDPNKEILSNLKVSDIKIIEENDMALSRGGYSNAYSKVIGYNIPYNNNEDRRLYTLDTAFHESKHAAQSTYWDSYMAFSAFSHHIGGSIGKNGQSANKTFFKKFSL